MPTVVCAALLAAMLLIAGTAGAQETKPESETEPVPAPAAMDNARLGALIERLDPEAGGRPGYWQLNIRDRAVVVITDERANRMRILAGVARSEGVPPELLYRLMQANFDTALDARYAIAQEVIWTAFIHPLGSLDEALFVSGLAQVVTLAETFGTTFSSGGMTFGGGDSGELLKELQDRLDSI